MRPAMATRTAVTIPRPDPQAPPAKPSTTGKDDGNPA